MRPSRPVLNRRRFLQSVTAAAVAGAAGLTPRRARAIEGERKFIFFYASGGWDVTSVFDPHFAPDGGPVDGVDMDELAEPVEIGGLRFTGGADRPNVERYFERWGQRSCIINGVDAHSVGHDSGMQFMLTGTSASSYPDWPTLMAGRAKTDYPLPHVVFSGPSFGGTYASAVVRAGGGVLLDLLDGSINGKSDRPSPVFQTPADSMMDAFVHRRVAQFAASRNAGHAGGGSERAAALQSNLERDMELEGRRFEAGLTDLGATMLDQGVKAAEMFRLGLSRCAMIQIDGGYDTHGTPSQADMFDAWFEAMDGLMEHMARTPGFHAERLIDEVVLVGMSEFGRTPKYNGGNGRDHWPYGAVFVAGSGVAGDQRVGQTDDSLISLPIDLSTGQPDEAGDIPACENVGCALLELAGIDPASHLPGVQVLDAILR